MKNIRKIIMVSIICLLIGTSVSASFAFHKDEKIDSIPNDMSTVITQNETIATCYLFRHMDTTTFENNISYELGSNLVKLFKECSVDSSNKEALIDTLYNAGFIPEGVSNEELIALLNPPWMNNLPPINWGVCPLSSSGTSFFCSVASGGAGKITPIILLPRPRIFLSWEGYEDKDFAITTVGNIRTNKGFIAAGSQQGIALGFIGMGLTYGTPFGTVYGFTGYTLYTYVKADDIEFYPPNNKPAISSPNPSNGQQNVPLSLSELSFRIDDADNDLMSYTVATDPFIGSGSGNSKRNGFYSIPISSLEPYRTYRWAVSISDGKDTTEKTFSFMTEDQPLDPFNPFEEEWQYRKKITIQHTKVAGDITDFPTLISIRDPDLRDKAQTDGDDILFMDSSGVANKLYHEIELFNKISGEIVAWVRIPSVSSSVDTELYLYYGNLETSNQQFPEKTWNSNFKGVWHLNENPAETIRDSTINDNNGASHGSMTLLNMVDGKVGKCIDFDGIDDYISIPNSVSLCPSEVTLVCWLYPEELDLNGKFHIGKMCKDKWGNYDAASYGILYDNRTVSTYYERNENGGFKVVANADGIDRWYHIATSMDSSHNIKIYLDGILKNQSNCGQSIRYTDAKELYLAASHISTGSGINSWEDCKIDEIWILDVPLDDQWISTLYKNQNDPSHFLSFGPEEIGP